MKIVGLSLVAVLFAAPAWAVPIYEVGVESMQGSVVLTPSYSEAWQPELASPYDWLTAAGLPAPSGSMICPADYRCQYNALGWSVYVETNVGVSPGTGTLGLNGGESTAAVDEPPAGILLAVALLGLGLFHVPRRFKFIR